MKIRALYKSLIAVALVAGCAAPTEKPVGKSTAAASEASLRVLFIGNSQFGFAPDPPMVGRALESLSIRAHEGDAPIEVSLAQVGGVGCSGYWEESREWMEPRTEAASGPSKYDLVILQPS